MNFTHGVSLICNYCPPL